MQIFSADVRPDDIVLFEDRLHWVKSPDLAIDPTGSLPFLSFDANCFYKQWAFGEGQAQGHQFHKVLECPSAAGIQSAVRSGLGVAMLNGQHVTADMKVIDDVFPPPPDITYIVRTRAKRPGSAVSALIGEIAGEVKSAIPLRIAG